MAVGTDIQAGHPIRVCAIIVTFFPDAGIEARIRALLSEFEAVVVVDNGTDGEYGRRIDGVGAIARVVLVRSTANRGLAAGLNQGISKAREQGFDWCVTFDQDTRIEPGFLQEMLAALASTAQTRVLIGANYWHVHRGRPKLACATGQLWIDRKTVITSGTLMRTDTVREIGPFREDYFIDSLDHEFCLRARRHGYRVLMTCRPLMHQHIGLPEPGFAWLRSLSGFQHGSPRKYYMARNTVLNIRAFVLTEPAWCLGQVGRLIGELALTLLSKHERYARTAAFLAGARDGLLGRTGVVRPLGSDTNGL